MPGFWRLLALIVAAASAGVFGHFLLFTLLPLDPMFGGPGLWAFSSVVTWLVLGKQVANASTVRIVGVGVLSSVVGAFILVCTFTVSTWAMTGRIPGVTPKTFLVFPFVGPMLTAPISLPLGVCMSFIANSALSTPAEDR